jgi:transposase
VTKEESEKLCAKQAGQIAILTQQVEWLKRQLFGRKSERLDHPDLFEEGDDTEAGKPDAPNADHLVAEGGNEDENRDQPEKKRKIRVAKLPENLPVVEQERIPSDVQADPEQWRRIGEEIREQIEKEPGYFYILRTIRPKYVPIDEPHRAPIISPARPQMIENGFYGTALLSEILCNRYLYHLPYYRQAQLNHQRFGIDLDTNTMGDAAAKIGDQCAILCRRMKVSMLAGGHIQADETAIRYLDPTSAGGSSQGYFWVYRAPDGNVIFDWQTSREHRHLREWLGPDYEGVIQSDGYAAYTSYLEWARRRGKKLSRAACLAHIRRKFKEALPERPATVRWILKIIRQLYEIEDRLRRNKASPAERERVRQNNSRYRIELLRKAIDHLLTKSIRPKSRLGLALRYALGQWPAMGTYLGDGQVEIDNNLIENAIRPSAVGKKNWLFVGSAEAGDRGAVIYSLLLSARAHGVDPQAYLKAVIEELPSRKSDDIDDLLPENWARANRKTHPYREPKRATDRRERRAAA